MQIAPVRRFEGPFDPVFPVHAENRSVIGADSRIGKRLSARNGQLLPQGESDHRRKGGPGRHPDFPVTFNGIVAEDVPNGHPSALRIDPEHLVASDREVQRRLQKTLRLRDDF